MRATERELKKRHQALPEDKKKADTTKNSDNLDEVIEQHLKQSKRLYPLRINKTTVIYVTKDKCNEEYRQKFIAKTNVEADNCNVRHSRISISKEELQSAIANGASQVEIAKRLGVSVTTVRNKMKEYGLL